MCFGGVQSNLAPSMLRFGWPIQQIMEFKKKNSNKEEKQEVIKPNHAVKDTNGK